ncbi:GNAT family N-acetyltransferase [Prochlorococcus marinus]|uniref:GNAT family N-acetyltransferase n=1 Tax=Prochlorococcus marinus TaxID=1219 RepID=UPI0022B3AF2F|nr:GNAT family N-acetyltransferase [Prochlorococcus marinus]
MKGLSLVKHAPTAPGLRLLGMGARFQPTNGLVKLQSFLNENTFWARGRNKKQICTMLYQSTVVVSLWNQTKLIGFGRATSDLVFRAVLWDIVIASDHQGLGMGKLILEAILTNKKIKSVEKIYLMTTNSAEFYKQLGFTSNHNQSLLILNQNEL